MTDASRDNGVRGETDFFVDTGSWCCRTCATANAKEEGAGQSFVFWHEQNEDGLHEYPSFEMPLCYGVAKKNASDQEIVDTAKKIISVLEEFDFKCDWKDGDIDSLIIVHLDAHKPDVEDEDECDYQNVCLYIPENEDTKEFCMNESLEELGEPPDTFYFYHRIKDGESLKDAVLRLDQKVWKHITHYQRYIDMSDEGYPVEPIYEIEHEGGHACCDESLLELLEEEDY